METIKMKVRIGEDGILRLEVPTNMTSSDVEIILVMQPLADAWDVDENGWPLGFFDRTYGALADDPIERPPQPPLEERDPIE